MAASLTNRNNSGIYVLVVLAINFVIFVIGAVVFAKNRCLAPIRARSPRVHIVLNISLFISSLAVALKVIFWEDIPCLLNPWIDFIYTVTLAPPYLYKLLHYYVRCELAHERLLMLEQANSCGEKVVSVVPRGSNIKTRADTWWLRHQHLASTRYLIIPSIISVMAFLTLPLYTLSQPSLAGLNMHDEDCLSTRKSNISISAVAQLGSLVAFLILAYKLRQSQDNFSIKQEFIYLGLLALPVLVVWTILGLGFRKIARDEFASTSLMAMLFHTIVGCTGTVYPLRVSRAFNKMRDELLLQKAPSSQILQEDDHPFAKMRLREALGNRQFFEAFQRFLTLEFSVENLLFVYDVGVFREAIKPSASTVELYAWARAIYDTYVRPGSPMWVNLSIKIMDRVSQKLSKHINIEDDAPELVTQPVSIQMQTPLPQSTNLAQRQLENHSKHTDIRLSIPDSSMTDSSSVSSGVALPLAHASKSVSLSPELQELFHMFDQAEASIMSLMEEDSFGRFKLHDAWRTLIAEVPAHSIEVSQAPTEDSVEDTP